MSDSRAKTILCVGTTPTVQRTMTFERVDIGEVNRAVGTTESASGKSLNVARVATTLGQRVVATGFAGGDRGKFMLEDLDRAGIPHDFVGVKATTRLCTTVIDRAAHTHTELIEESLAVEPADWATMLGKVQALLSGAGLMVLSGSLPPGAPQDFYQRCIEMATTAGVDSIIDARGEPLRLALKAKPAIVKLNRAELASTLDRTLGDDAAVMAALKDVRGFGVRWAIATMGADGAIAVGESIWKALAPSVEVVSSIGSGDSFAAGLAVASVRGDSLQNAVKLATACAVANTLSVVPGELGLDDVSRFERAVDTVRPE